MYVQLGDDKWVVIIYVVSSIDVVELFFLLIFFYSQFFLHYLLWYVDRVDV